MFNKIIWATDGSPAADKALPLAKGLAQQGGGSLVVVHIVEHIVGPKAGGETVQVDESELKAKIEQQVAELSSEGIGAELRVESGHQGIAAHAIADVAREVGADLIVVGTRGHTGLGAVVLGSVTQRLLHITSCPVLAIPDHV